MEITDTPDSLSFSLVCPRTLDTHMLEFSDATTKKEWLDAMRSTLQDWTANINVATLAPPDAEPELPGTPRLQAPAFHASQVLPKEVAVAVAAEVIFQIPATVPVWDAKEGKEFTACVIDRVE